MCEVIDNDTVCYLCCRANGAEATQEDGGTIMEILRVTSGHSGALQMQGSGYLRVEVEGQPASIAACRSARCAPQQAASLWLWHRGAGHAIADQVARTVR